MPGSPAFWASGAATALFILVSDAVCGIDSAARIAALGACPVDNGMYLLQVCTAGGAMLSVPQLIRRAYPHTAVKLGLRLSAFAACPPVPVVIQLYPASVGVGFGLGVPAAGGLTGALMCRTVILPFIIDMSRILHIAAFAACPLVASVSAVAPARHAVRLGL